MKDNKYFIAHRGVFNSEIKENTIESFKKAINDSNFIGFELDIHTTKDNIFVVNHSSIHQGKKINNTNYRDLKLPTLESVLKLKTNKIIMIEIKEYNLNINRFEKLLNKYKNKKIYVISFLNKVITKLNNINYKKGLLDFGLIKSKNYTYDFICLLKPTINYNLINYYLKENIPVFIYGITSLDDIIYFNVTYIIDAKLFSKSKE